MFAVPGWSLAADSLKPEAPASSNGAGPAKSKKRKRPNGGREREEAVTADNVAALYDSVVGGVKPEIDKSAQGAKKRQRKGPEGKPKKDSRGREDDAEAAPVAESGEKGEGKEEKKAKDTQGPDKAEKKKDKKENKERKEKKGKEKKEKKTDKESEPHQPQAAPLPKPSAALTPLQAAMREKLISARFRHLNETLYTRPSEESFGLFRENPEMFDEYHQGFRRQVKVWPENPVDSFLQDIRARGAIRTPHNQRDHKGRPNHHQQQQNQQLSRTPLPRTAGTCVIADLGCGDARLAESLQADGPKARIEVRSFDLQSASPLVTAADIANLPLEDGSVNVAVFCLALMGTNWLSFVEEAYRVLHWKGELWVAEIKSRFGPVTRGGNGGKNAPVAHSVGNRRKAQQQPDSKKKKEEANAALQGRYEQDLAVEVDGQDDTRRETDVSAFVEALRKRGFVLQGERGEAVDLSNRMFVKMHFLKGAAPTVGKGVKEKEKGVERPVVAAPRKRKMFQFEQGDDGGEGADEAAILKPCVYKIR